MTTLLLALTLAQTPAPSPDQTVNVPGNGIAAPQLVRRVEPTYTREAILARKQGTVILQGVVDVDGSFTDVRVLRSLDPELDAQAVKASQQWQFRPGMKDGKPVRVPITLEMSFSLSGGGGDTPPVIVFRRSELDGSQTTFEIANVRFQQLPRWDPVVTATPPLTTADAIQTATRWIPRIAANAANLVLSSVTLRHFSNLSSNNWFYQIDFVPAVRDPNGIVNPVTAVVLFDGSVVEPKR